MYAWCGSDLAWLLSQVSARRRPSLTAPESGTYHPAAEMQEFSGIAVSPGIGIGLPWVLQSGGGVPRYFITPEAVEAELSRLSEAISGARRGILELRSAGRGDELAFLDAHLLLIDDPEFTDRIEQRIREARMNGQRAVSETVAQAAGKLEQIPDDYLRERALDLRDVGRRIIRQLQGDAGGPTTIPDGSVLIADDLMPSELLAIDRRRLVGIAVERGGKTSHTAILARAFEIPTVMATVGAVAAIGDDSGTVVVDGNRGRLFVEPDAQQVRRYQVIQRAWRKREVSLMSLNELPAETPDGKLISLKANIELPVEVDAVLSHGADGVGLFRTEFLFMQPGALPDEEQQFQHYRSVLEAMRGKPVTIRTVDIGGDKLSPQMETGTEANPILGWRAIRYCISHPEVLETQLRALLRASVYGELQIMFPMISGIEELNLLLDILDAVRASLLAEGHAVADDVPAGIMVEVPSAAMTADILAHRSRFFSVGTNDLIQYTIAVDRSNERIAYLYQPFHPAILRTIQQIVVHGHRSGIPVAMCGEMAGDPLSAVVLLGLGLDELSMSAFTIPEVKRIIRSVRLQEAEELVGRLLDLRSWREIGDAVRTFLGPRLDADVLHA